MDPIDEVIRQNNVEIKRVAKRLKNNAEYLRDHMNALAQTAATIANGEDPTATISSNGEVQGNGLTIDLDCARMRQLREFASALAYAAEMGAKPDPSIRVAHIPAERMTGDRVTVEADEFKEQT